MKVNSISLKNCYKVIDVLENDKYKGMKIPEFTEEE